MSDPTELIKSAEKLAKPSSGFLSFFGPSQSSRYEEAADIYVQAANLYKLQKNAQEAGSCFEKAATLQEKAGSPDEAGNTLVDAFKSFKLSNPAQAASVMERAIVIFTQRGQFRRGANFKFDLGQLYEEDLNDFSKAMAAYEEAGDWYSQDQASALANKSYLKCADLRALNGEYASAVDTYRKIIKTSVNNAMSKWGLKDLFMKVALCQLAMGDSVAAEKLVRGESLEMDPSFQSTREFKLLESVLEDVRDGDAEAFSQHVFDFDQFSKLDKWKTTLLLKVKETIADAEDDLL